MRRVRKVPKEPNPLFLHWLEEWSQEARQKGNTPLAKIYAMCRENLAKYVVKKYVLSLLCDLISQVSTTS